MSAQDGKNMWASGEVWMGKGESMDAGKARGRWVEGGGGVCCRLVSRQPSDTLSALAARAFCPARARIERKMKICCAT